MTSAEGRPEQEIRVRRRLQAERAAAQEQLDGLHRDFDLLVAAAADVATDDEHDPEGATMAFERAQVMAVADSVARHLADLEQALSDLATGRYGKCERCEQTIGAERMAARPAARRCLPCASGN